MLTRSLIQSYLLLKDSDKIELYRNWLEIINKEKCIRIKEPTPSEIEEIKKNRTK